MINDYVLGFAFDRDVETAECAVGQTRVALIHKRKPDWQAGFMNGIGGKIEDFDHTGGASRAGLLAMVREFHEETGHQTEVSDWSLFHSMGSEDWQVQCYRAFSVPLDELRTMEEEKIEIIQVSDLYHRNVLRNLRWLIPLAIDSQPYPTMQVYR